MGFLKRFSIGFSILLGLVGYYLIGYTLERTDHIALFGAYTVLFAVGIVLLFTFARNRNSWGIIFILGVLFRLVFLFSSPSLSDDYFRFTWDGELLNIGESPFSFLPKDYEIHFEEDSLLEHQFQALYNAKSVSFPEGMNSRNYHSVYPPINQFVFAIASQIGSPNNGSLIVIRCLILLMEVLSFFVLSRLLLKKGRVSWLIGLYWLNPLVIIELTGNLHFEAFAIGFLLLTLYYLMNNKTNSAGLSMALAISAKLNPIFLIGAAFKQVPFNKFLRFTIIGGVMTCLGFVILLDNDTFWNFKNSFGLYFTWFEFNASFFYLLRGLGFLMADIDITPNISLIFPLVTVLIFLLMILRNTKKDIYERLLLLYMVYFSFTPVVHPWYITIMLPLAILSGRLYPIAWSFLIFFTYTAYGETYGESYGLIAIEYGLVYLLMYLEYRYKDNMVKRLISRLYGVGRESC